MGCKERRDGNPTAKNPRGLLDYETLYPVQEVWDPLVVRMKVEWDEKIEDIELSRKWFNWLSELEKCDDVILAR